MTKQKPFRKDDEKKEELAREAEAARLRNRPDTLMGMPRERLPLIILFMTVTIGSFIVWSLFSRKPMLDQYTYNVVAEYPHDTDSFTQGLIFRDGIVYESTGKYEQSKIRKINLTDGKVIDEKKLANKYFGEGLCEVDGRLVQITWQEYTGFVWDYDLNLIDEFKFDAHGWGLTYNGEHLILSDGTCKLQFLNQKTFAVERSVLVKQGNSKLFKINELEYINGTIFANVLNDNHVYMIDPKEGKVTGKINFEELYPSRDRTDDESVLNGIAIRPDNGNLLVTGKNWPKIFEVKITKAPN